MKTTTIGANAQEITYEELLRKVCAALLPKDGCRDLLPTVPHRDMEDLSIVFFVGKGYVITNNMLEDLEVPTETFVSDALAAAARNFPAEAQTVEHVLQHSVPGFEPDERPAEWQLFVVANEEGNYGASVLAYPGFLEQAAEKLGGDLYVIPSSIHKALLMRKREAIPAAGLAKVVRNINAVLKPNEVLSDHVYQYDARTRTFEIAI